MKIAKHHLIKLIREAIESSLEYSASQEMGEYADGPLSEWTADEFMSYLDETAQMIEMGHDIPHEATVEYVKSRFPDLVSEIDEMFSEDGTRVMPPVFEAFEDMLVRNHPASLGQVLQGEEGTFKVSEIKKDEISPRGYRWWLWGNIIDPLPFEIDATGQDRDGKNWTAEEMFQEITGGNVSKFKTPAEWT